MDKIKKNNVSMSNVNYVVIKHSHCKRIVFSAMIIVAKLFGF